MNKAVFLDRDGTINREVNYLYRKEDFEFINNTADAIKIFRNLGYLVIVITNQSGIARNYYTLEDVYKLHSFIDKKLSAAGTFIDEYYICPHHKDGNNQKYSIECDCRKPEIGLLLNASIDYDLKLDECIMIGDKESDVLAGKNAGITENILVRSGHEINEVDTCATGIFDTIYDYAIKRRMQVNETV